MAQTKAELDEFYMEPDPWGYESHPDDQLRKDFILAAVNRYRPVAGRTLDIGAGEGFITRDIPGRVSVIETSDTAAERLPDHIERIYEPSVKFELVLACGVLYAHYEVDQIYRWINRAIATGGHIITCNIKEWEVSRLPKNKLVDIRTFPYREYTEVLRVYKW